MLEAELGVFTQYNAAKPEKIINSADENSSRMWARKAAFLQLGYTLIMYQEDNQLSSEQNEAINLFNEHVFSTEFQNQPLTLATDIAMALGVLEILGLDVSQQREQLKTWH